MANSFRDNIEVRLQLGTTRDGLSLGGVESDSDSGSPLVPGESSFDDDAIFWDAVSLRVELTQASSPNYVKGKITPKIEFTDEIRNQINAGEIGADGSDEEDIPGVIRATDDKNVLPTSGISQLVGSRFRLAVRNEFAVVPSADNQNATKSRDKDENIGRPATRLLFDGRLANISPVGTNLYEFLAYDPGQQAFNTDDTPRGGGEAAKDAEAFEFFGRGSIINQKLKLTGDIESDDEEQTYHISGREVIQKVVDSANLRKYKIKLDAPRRRIALHFTKAVVTVKEALDRLSEQTDSSWWFDKDGTFYFGDPGNPELGGGVETYETRFIKETSAGITTPPYQSVKVIYSGGLSDEESTSNQQIVDVEDRPVKRANIGLPSQVPRTNDGSAKPVIELSPLSDLHEPTFKYVNMSISSDSAAENAAISICREFFKQQGSGTVTVVGFPEVQPYDGIIMPNTQQQPMGGQMYDVYKVVHKINPSDGFVTDIEVAGPNPEIRGETNIGEDYIGELIAASDGLAARSLSEGNLPSPVIEQLVEEQDREIVSAEEEEGN